MQEDELRRIKLHVAGATVIHDSPFGELKSHVNSHEITQEFRGEWVVPYYLNIHKSDEAWIGEMAVLSAKISDEIILKCLGDFNWRTRSVGAFFAGIKGKAELIDIIGIHLLKSEVCYVGRTYAVVLASFNDQKGIRYLELYLDYYLRRLGLWFDQSSVIAALKYLDVLNGTDRALKYLDPWERFVSDKENWKEAIDITRMENAANVIHEVRKRAV